MIKIDGEEGSIKMEGTMATILADFTMGLRELYHRGDIGDRELDTLVDAVKMSNEELREDAMKKVEQIIRDKAESGDEESKTVLEIVDALHDLLKALRNED